MATTLALAASYISAQASDQKRLISIARTAVENEVLGLPPAKNLDESPSKPVFVTIEVDGKVVGCRGGLVSRSSSLEEEISLAARGAALHDPRYRPLTKSELKHFLVTVTIVDRLQPLVDLKSLTPDQGLVLTSGSRTGVVLPWEGSGYGSGPYTAYNLNYSGEGQSYAGGQVNCDGEVTITYKWINGNAPASILVDIQCRANAYGEDSVPEDSSVDDGFEDPVVYSDRDNSQGYFSGVDASLNFLHHYKMLQVTNNVATFTFSPSASATSTADSPYDDGCVADVIIETQVLPFTITLSGGATDGGLPVQDFLVGQKVQATLSPLPQGVTAGSFSWTASGASPFASYVPSSNETMPQGVTPFGNTNSSFSCYFAGATSTSDIPQISCSAVLMYAGQPLDSGTTSTSVRLYSPTPTPSTAIGSQAIEQGISSPILALYNAPNVPSSVPPCGVWFGMSVSDPSAPALFDNINGTTTKGTWVYDQTMVFNSHKYLGVESYTDEVIVSNDPFTGAPTYTLGPVNDGDYFYEPKQNDYPGFNNFPADGAIYPTSDTPFDPLVASELDSISEYDTFKMYIIYTPPSPPGFSSMPVSLGYFLWSFPGSAAKDSNGNYYLRPTLEYAGTPLWVPWASDATFPAWVVTNRSEYWVPDSSN